MSFIIWLLMEAIKKIRGMSKLVTWFILLYLFAFLNLFAPESYGFSIIINYLYLSAIYVIYSIFRNLYKQYKIELLEGDS